MIPIESGSITYLLTWLHGAIRLLVKPNVRERADDAGAAPDLAGEPLDGVVGADPPPVLNGEPRASALCFVK